MRNTKSIFGGYLPLLLVAFVLLCTTNTDAGRPRKCHHAADIMILVDSSSSVKLKTFHYEVKPFLEKLFKRITKVVRHPRTSLATFDKQFNHAQRFTYDNERVLTAINDMTYMGGVTALSPALREAAKYVKYFGRKGVDAILIVVSDGHPTLGKRVRKVLKKVRAVFDIIIPIGITKAINQYRLGKLAKHSKLTRLTHIRRKKAISSIIREICRPIAKKCPKSAIYRPRCLGRHVLFRTVVYRRHGYLCLRRVHSSLRRVRCKLSRSTAIICRRCQRLLVRRSWRIRNCRCVPRVKARHIGKCCCQRPTRIRKCLNTKERVDYTLHDFVNGQCWLRKFRCNLRCACPKIPFKKFCLKTHLLERQVVHRMAKDRQCVQFVNFLKAPILCRHVTARAGPCFKRATGHGYEFVRKVHIITYTKSKGCRCHRKIRLFIEPCKRKTGPRWKWTRLCDRLCTRTCKGRCFRERTWYIYKLVKAPGGVFKCRAVPVARRRYRCCCRPNHSRRLFCKGNRWIKSFGFTKLLGGKCVRFTKVVVKKNTCCEGVVSRTGIHRRRRLAAIVEVYQFRRGCRCVRRKRTLYIRPKCPKASYRKVCRGGKLYIHRWYSYSLGRGCVTRHQRKYVKAHCPKHRRIVSASCYKGRKYVLYEKVFRVRCRCVVRLVKSRRGHCRCPKKWNSQWRCYRHRYFIRRAVVYKRDRKGRCRRRRTMVVKRLLGCRRQSWRTYHCNRKTGVLLVYRNVRRLKHCLCKKSRKLIHYARCHCKLINKKYGHRSRLYCDRRRNDIVTVRTYFVHDRKEKSCVRKRRIYRRSIRCSRKVRTHVSKCDLLKRRRRITRTGYVRVNCRCLRRQRVTYEQCGCASRQVRVVCNRKLGVVVRIIHLKVWNRKLDRCDRTKRTVRIPIRCLRGVRVRRSACNQKFYTETRTWFAHKKRSCSCLRRTKTRRISCYCPPKTRITPCRGYYKFRVTQFFAWDPVSKRCQPFASIRVRLQCRCPPPRSSRQCLNGRAWITQVRYALRKGTCVESVSITRQSILCTADAKITWSKCKRCHRIRTVHSRFPHPKTCRCVFRPTSRTRCRCCPCPRSKTSTQCRVDRWVRKTVSYTAVRRDGCISHCVRSVRVRSIRVRCPRRPASFWTKCTKCRLWLVKYRRAVRNCRCQFRRVRTGVSRRCCCPKASQTRRCRNGDIVVTKVHYVLTKKCCRMVKSVVKYRKICPLIRAPIIVKKCNPRSCIQLLLIPRIVLVRGTCKCRIVRVQRRRKCCCRRKGHRYTICLGACWLTRIVRYKFHHGTRLCVRKSATVRGCLRCRGPVTTRGACNKRSCYRFVTRTRYGFLRSAFLGQCHCRPRVSRWIERCCCPSPSPWFRSCKRNTIVRRRTLYVLRGSECRRIVQVRRKQIRCRRGVIGRRVGSCDQGSCTRSVTNTYERRLDCHCERYRRRRFIRCCCPPPRTRRVCVRNNIVTDVTTFYRLVKGNCIPSVRSTNVRRIPSCPSIRKLFACNPKTKVRKGYIQTYRVKNCECVPARGIQISVPCGCPGSRVRYTACHRSSCRRNRITVDYVLRGRRCVRSRRVLSERCCCKGPLVQRSIRCNPRTGQKEKITVSRVFVRGAKYCVTLRSRTSLGIGLNCFAGGVRIKRGGCNKRTRIAVDVLTSFRHVRRNCRCVRRVLRRKRVCACPGCRTQRSCRRGVNVVRTTCFHLYAGSCHRIIRTRRSIVPCRRNQRVLRKCKGCKGTVTELQNVRVGCRCIRRRKTRSILCCCPPPKRRVVCVNPFLQTVVTGYVRNRSRTRCLPIVVRRSVRVKACRRRRKRILKCSRRTCKRTIYTLIYGFRRCNCVLLRKVRRAVTCCCPRPKKRRICNRANGVLTILHIRYKLKHGSCVRSDKIIQRETRCDKVSVRVGHCQRGSRSVIIRGERRVNCVCKPTLRSIHEKCQCPASRVVKQPCHANKKWRQVFLVYFRLIVTKNAEICKRHIKKLYFERCKCPPSFVRRRCVGGAQITDRITYRLSRRYGQRICVGRRRRTKAVVVCKDPKIVRYACSACRQKVRRTTWRVIKCKCRQFRSFSTEPCNCHQKNSRKTKCMGSVLVHTVTFYKRVAGYKRCVPTTRSVLNHVVCPRKYVVPLSASCTIQRNKAAYRKYKTVWFTRHGCRCVKHSRWFVGLCQCRKNYVEKKCYGSAIKVTRHYFLRKGLRCQHVIKVKKTPLKCRGRRVSVRRGKCDRRTCLRVVSVTSRRIKNCKCRSVTRSARQRCCVPRPITRKFCDPRHGHHVFIRRRFFLRKGRPLLRKGGVTIRRKVIDGVSIVRRERVICPASTRRRTCNRSSGIETSVWVRWRRSACRCKRQVRRVRGRCRCRRSHRRSGRCYKGRRNVKIVLFVKKAGRCVARAVVKRERCACPRNRVRRFCDRRRGHRVTCHTRNRFDRARKACRRTITCRSRVVPCGLRRVTRGGCNRKIGLRTVRIRVHRLNRRRCRCVTKVYKRTERCSCSHLNRRRKGCVRNRFVSNVSYRFVLSNGLCALQFRRTLRETVCPKRRSVRSACATRGKRRGFLVQTTTYFVPKNCACVRRRSHRYVRCSCKFLRHCRRTVRRNCIRNVRVTHRSVCVLHLGVCQKRIQTSLRELRCRRIVRVRSKPCRRHSDGASYKNVVFSKLTLRNCKCTWTVFRTLKRVCRCPSPRITRRCLRNRVRITTTVRFSRHASRSHCRASLRSRAALVVCPRDRSRSSCNRRTCQRRIVVERYVPVKCRCQRTRKILLRTCCCPRASPKRRSCAPDGRTIVVRWRRFSFALGRCFPVVSFETRRVRCERRTPKVIVGPCRRNRRRKSVVSFHTKRCACVARKRVTHIRCGCSRKVFVQRGVCKGSFATDLVISFRLKKRCVRVVLRRRRRCRCPQPHRRTACNRHNELITRFVTYRLVKGSCVRRVVKRSRLLDGCDQSPAVVRRERGLCRGRRRTVRVILVVARHCRCRRVIRRSSEACNCYRASKVVRRCQGHKVMISETQHFLKRKGRCVVVRRRRRRTLRCVGTRSISNSCKGRNYRSIRVYRRVARRCKCSWRLIRTRKALCRCPRPRISRACVRNRWNRHTRVSFALSRGKCLRRVVTVLTRVCCHVGHFRHRSACSPSGFRVITHVTRRLHNCKCVVHRRRRRCRCRCPSARSSTVCLTRRGVRRTVTVTHVLRNCGCVRLRRARSVRIACSRTLRHVGPCRRARNGNSYRVERITIRKRSGCRCRKTFRTRRVLCGCDPRPRHIVRCKGGKKLVSIITRVVRTGKRCRRVRYRIQVRRVVCGRSKRSIMCKNNVKIIKIWHRFVRNCSCREIVRIVKGHCKCPPRRRLIRRGACVNCQRILVFSRRVSVGILCVRRLIHVKQRCCCPKTVRRSRRCNRATGVVTTVIRALRFVKGRCVWQTGIAKKKTRCSRRKRRHVLRRNDGFEEITVSRYRRVACGCRIRQRKFLRRWACPHQKFKFRCTSRNMWMRRSIKFKLSKNRCLRLSKTKLIPVLCRFNRKWITKCSKVAFGTASRVVRLVYRKKKCRCIGHRSVRTVLCGCNEPQFRKRCHKNTLVYSLIKFVPRADKRACRRVVLVRKRKIRCQKKWRLVSRTACVKTFACSVAVGCRCRLKFRKVKRRVKCRKPLVVRSSCHTKTCLRHVRVIAYVKHRCHCVRRDRVRTVRCCKARCPLPRTLRSKCYNGLVNVRRVVFEWINGKCKRFEKRSVIKFVPKCDYKKYIPVGPCEHGIRVFKLITKVPRKCRCVTQEDTVERRCGHFGYDKP